MNSGALAPPWAGHPCRRSLRHNSASPFSPLPGMNVEFLANFFTSIKRLFSSYTVSLIKVISSAYPRSLIFLLAILIPACESSSLAFRMMYSAKKLNKQGDSIEL